MLYFLPQKHENLLPQRTPRVHAVARHFKPSSGRAGHLVQLNDFHTVGVVADLSKDELGDFDANSGVSSGRRRRIGVLVKGHTSYIGVLAHVASQRTLVGSMVK